MIIDVEKIIREYLPEVIHLSLATSVDNKPWVCELHYSFDDELNLYFLSLPSRRHSKEIEINHNVAGNIVKQHLIGEKPRGVYFEGQAEVLKDVDEKNIAYISYCERFGENEWTSKEIKKENGHRFYKITVNKFYLFDAIDSSPSQKYEIVWK